VNLASRLETLTKTVGRPIVISGATRERVGDEMDFEALGSEAVKGKTGTIALFTPA
jgi:adenylate cyclase